MDVGSTPLCDWPGHWLTVRCGSCGGLVIIPVRLLIERGVSRDMPVADAVDRMKCTRWHARLDRPCGGRVAEASLVDRPDHGASGMGRLGQDGSQERVIRGPPCPQ